MYRLVTLVILLLVLSCKSERLVVGIYQSKFYDEYLELNDHHKYRVYQDWFGIKPRKTGGRYIISGDTAYLIAKRKDKNYRMYGYILIDTINNSLTLQYIDSTSPERIYDLRRNKRPAY